MINLMDLMGGGKSFQQREASYLKDPLKAVVKTTAFRGYRYRGYPISMPRHKCRGIEIGLDVERAE